MDLRRIQHLLALDEQRTADAELHRGAGRAVVPGGDRDLDLDPDPDHRYRRTSPSPFISLGFASPITWMAVGEMSASTPTGLPCASFSGWRRCRRWFPNGPAACRPETPLSDFTWAWPVHRAAMPVRRCARHA